MKYIPVKIVKDYNYLVFHFEEEQKLIFFKKILEYLHASNDLHYYIFFGYSDFNVDIEKYKENYSELTKDHGFFKLKESDIWNSQMISDILYNYQMVSLYINKIPDLDQQYNFDDMCHSSNLFGGYVIDEMREDYISILKSDYMPDWDLMKMGVYIDQDYQISNPADTPVSFITKWQNANLDIEYTDMQAIKSGLLTGALFINGMDFSEYRFGGPFLYSSFYMLVPVYIKSFLKTICKLARIDLSDYSIELYGKGFPLIYLKEVDSGHAFFYTDLNKTKSDFVKIPRMGRVFLSETDPESH